MQARVNPILEMHHISKSFGATRALNNVTLKAYPGRILALIGENGAGKSTLIKIISAALKPDQGEILFQGNPYQPESPAMARASGVGIVYQELALAPDLSVRENLLLGMEPQRLGILTSTKEILKPARQFLKTLGIPLEVPIVNLSVANRQMVEIARCLCQKSRLLILDEPTSSLSNSETRLLFDTLRSLSSKGVALIYISHFLEEVQSLCNDYLVLRDGQVAGEGEISQVSLGQLISQMVGRENSELYPKINTPSNTIAYRIDLKKASGLAHPCFFNIHHGEILGLAGLIGSGRSELLKSLMGLNGKVQGQIEKCHENDSHKNSFLLDLARMNPKKAFSIKMGLLSEDRKEEGLALNLSIEDNISLPTLSQFRTYFWLALKHRRAILWNWIQKLGIKTRIPQMPVYTLSGGNQQKVAIGRLLHQELELLLLDEPTRGIDIGAKQQIYQHIEEAVQEGKSVIIAGSYLPELFGLCTSLLVMHRGSCSPVQKISEWTEESVMAWATTGALTLEPKKKTQESM